jgi:hypothetical protein
MEAKLLAFQAQLKDFMGRNRINRCMYVISAAAAAAANWSELLRSAGGLVDMIRVASLY